MSFTEHEKYLRIPLYKLYYIKGSLDEFDFKENFMADFKREYNLEQIHHIYHAVHWAFENPNYNFRELLPDLRFTNEEIYRYLTKLKDIMNIEYLKG